jgi:sensor histidine kinase YesM
LREQPILPLLLQPLVENSIRHGLEPQVQGGEISVRARREERSEEGFPRIHIEIRDTGTGLGVTAPSGANRFGISQVRQRLAAVYGARGSLTLESTPGSGTTATITFPA